MDIRLLNAKADHALVADLYTRAADYVLLEEGRAPTDDTVQAFLYDRPPKVSPNAAFHFGLFEDESLIGISGMIIGYPEPRDSYIGLLLLTPAARRKGYGKAVLDHVTRHANAAGASRQFVAVLEKNQKGRAFWEREGFVLERTFPPRDDAHTRYRMMRTIGKMAA